jgi:hypothetical protein
VFLLGAAVLSIRAGTAKGSYSLAAVDDMELMLGPDYWGINGIDARHQTAPLNIGVIATLRTGNKAKYKLVMGAMRSQAIGAFLLANFAMIVIAR